MKASFPPLGCAPALSPVAHLNFVSRIIVSGNASQDTESMWEEFCPAPGMGSTKGAGLGLEYGFWSCLELVSHDALSAEIGVANMLIAAVCHLVVLPC